MTDEKTIDDMISLCESGIRIIDSGRTNAEKLKLARLYLPGLKLYIAQGLRAIEKDDR